MNKRFSCVFGLLLLAAPLAQAQSSTWIPDKAHSGVDFSILHMSLSRVRGHFGNIGGTIVLDESDITKSTVNVTIDVNSVDTGVAGRDGDLKGPNFFDVAQFPTATFVSTTVVKNGNGLTVSGNLTLHGVTKPVVLQVEAPPDQCPEWMRSLTPGSQLQRRSAAQHSESRPNSQPPWWVMKSN
jgi:polyisoprenoid-binding protein YceI